MTSVEFGVLTGGVAGVVVEVSLPPSDGGTDFAGGGVSAARSEGDVEALAAVLLFAPVDALAPQSVAARCFGEAFK